MAGTAKYTHRLAAIATGGTFDGTTPQWAVNADGLTKNVNLLVSDGMKGYRQRQVEHERLGEYTILGSFTCNPSVAFLSTWLQWAMGGGSATAPAFAAAVPSIDVLVDKGAAVYKYTGCKISRLTLRGSSGQLFECTVDLIGKEETASAWAAAALGSTIAYWPIQAADLSWVYDSAAMSVENFELALDNGLTARHRMKRSVQDILENDREVTMRASSVFSAAEIAGIYADAGAPDSATSVQLAVTDGASTVSVTFTMSRTRFPPRSAVPQDVEFILPLEGVARGTAGGVEFTCAIDLTP